MIVYQDFRHWAIVLPLATPLIYKLLRKKQHITKNILMHSCLFPSNHKSNCRSSMARLVYNKTSSTYFTCCILFRTKSKTIMNKRKQAYIYISSIIACQQMSNNTNNKWHIQYIYVRLKTIDLSSYRGFPSFCPRSHEDCQFFLFSLLV